MKKTIITALFALIAMAGQGQVHYRIEGNIGMPHFTGVMEVKDVFMQRSVDTIKVVNGIIAPKEGDLPITSRYRVLKVYNGAGPEGEDVSDIEVELVTGRTHQIRAQFAHLGHPIIGDGNYGRNQYNLHFKNLRGGKVRYQQLFASTLLFGKIPKENIHHRLSGRSFSIEPLYDVKL